MRLQMSWHLSSNNAKPSAFTVMVTATDLFSYQKLWLKNNLVLQREDGVTQKALRWRHNVRDSVSNHQPHDCLLNRLFRRRSKKTSKLRVTGLCAGNSPGTGEFPAQMASYGKMFPFDDVIMGRRDLATSRGTSSVMHVHILCEFASCHRQ